MIMIEAIKRYKAGDIGFFDIIREISDNDYELNNIDLSPNNIIELRFKRR